MNIGFVKEALFNRFRDKKPGDIAISENLGLLVHTILGPKAIISGHTTGTAGGGGNIRIGNLLVQFGRASASGTGSFRITFPEQFGAGMVYGFIQEAGNDATRTDIDPIYNRAQLDGTKLPDSTGMDVVVESGHASEYYFWLAIGAA